jgi:hypothetical protein
MISDTSNVARNLAVARSSQCHRRDENTCGATAPHRRTESVARVEDIPPFVQFRPVGGPQREVPPHWRQDAEPSSVVGSCAARVFTAVGSSGIRAGSTLYGMADSGLVVMVALARAPILTAEGDESSRASAQRATR